MPREARKESSTSIYHIMTRGINKLPIFQYPLDKHLYFDYIRESIVDFDINIYAYCIMNNHAHFLLKGSLHQISKFMKVINVKYAKSYNLRYTRVGHLFQDRYKSECIEDEIYFMSALRYIHCNPVKAGYVNYHSKYKWSSMVEYEWKQPIIISDTTINEIRSVFKSEKNMLDFHKEESIIEHIDISLEDEWEIDKAKSIIKNFNLPIKNSAAKIVQRRQLINKIKNETKVTDTTLAKLLNVSKTTIKTAQDSRKIVI